MPATAVSIHYRRRSAQLTIVTAGDSQVQVRSAKKALNLSVPPQTSSRGDLLPVYRRADLSRTMMLVLVLFLTAASTGGFAREFLAADTQKFADYYTPTEHAMSPEGLVMAPFEAAMAGIYTKAQKDPAIAQLIERIRKVQ
jgi:hypothetical protein